MLIQRFSRAVNLNIHLYCLVLDGVDRHSAEGGLAARDFAPLIVDVSVAVRERRL